MVLGSALDIFSREGFSYLSRWSHVIVGITWMGLLWFFNFVQMPAYAEMEAGARNNAFDKLTWRGAVVVPLGGRGDASSFGILLIGHRRRRHVYNSDFWKSHGRRHASRSASCSRLTMS